MREFLRWLATALDSVMRFLAALLGTYYSAKYALVSRRISGPRVTDTDRRGFVIIQIDGLSYDHLRAAIQLGYAPHLRRLLERRGLHLYPWKPGIPGTTPASQAGIMFGDSDLIPAFRWYDKEAGQVRVCSDPEVAREIQETLSAEATGILHGGSSYMNMFDGGAALSRFTLGTLGKSRFFEGLRGLSLFALFAVNPFRSGTMLILVVWEYLTDLFQRVNATIRGTTPRPLSRVFPFLRVMSSVVMREIQTYSVAMDIFRGVPAIYTTYYGYDEVAHHYGPLSKPALRALRAIDKRVHTIDRWRQMEPPRQYDLYVLSDHGMTEGTPFAIEYGRTLGEVVHDLVGRSTAIREIYSAQQGSSLSTLYVQQELEAIEASFRPPFSRLPHYLASYVERHLPPALDEQDVGPASASDVVVSSSGSLSHIYLCAQPGQLGVSEIGALYPMLVSSLLSHPGIWLVIGREAGRIVILSKEGVLSVGNDVRTEGEDPLRSVPYGDWARRQIVRLASLPESGDLILVGRYDPDTGRVSCFESQWACHGGLGGPQDVAVLITEPHIAWPLSSVERASGIYRLFTRQYDIP